MSYMTKESINKRLQEHLDTLDDFEVFGIFLQGSQNYIDDLFYEDSDVDSRAILIPNVREVCLGIDISKPEKVLDNDEHIDLFDVRKFLNLISTPGINNYECLFSEYFIINPDYQEFYDELVDLREKIARMNEKKFLMASMGISNRDFKILTTRKGGEDYDIQNFGYSRKRLSNIMRINATMKAYIQGKPFNDCLKALPQEDIHKTRRTHHYQLNEALELAEKLNEENATLAKNFPYTPDNETTKTKMQNIIVDLLTKSMKA